MYYLYIKTGLNYLIQTKQNLYEHRVSEKIWKRCLGVLGFLMISAAVSACSTPPARSIEIKTRPVSIPELVLPEADSMKSRPVEWIIITPENYEEVFKRLQSSGREIVLFGLTNRGYENLSLNINDMRTFVQQQNSIILAYRNYYIRSRATLNNAVTVQ